MNTMNSTLALISTSLFCLPLLEELGRQEASRGARNEVEIPAPADVMAGPWLDRAVEGIRAAEYHFTAGASGTSAPNRANNLRATFRDGGVLVEHRTEAGARYELRLETTALGRGSSWTSTAVTGPARADGSRLEIPRTGLTEWFVNEPAGLEQGWTVPAAPAGDGPLFVEVSMTGLAPRIGVDSRSAQLALPSGETVLSYRGLHAFDAGGGARDVLPPTNGRWHVCIGAAAAASVQ